MFSFSFFDSEVTHTNLFRQGLRAPPSARTTVDWDFHDDRGTGHKAEHADSSAALIERLSQHRWER
jgi:hypothetical protein